MLIIQQDFHAICAPALPLFLTCPAYFTPHIGIPVLYPKSTTQASPLSESSQYTDFLLLTPPWPLVVLDHSHIITFFHLLNVSCMSALSLQPGSKRLMLWDCASCTPNPHIHTVHNMSSEYASSLMGHENGMAFLLVWMTTSYFKTLMTTDYIK